jgi:hypothetical protein
MKRALAILLAAAPASAQTPSSWELKIPERVELAAGVSGTLPIAIVIDRGLTISKDAALILDLAPDAGVTIKKRRLGRGDAIDPDADSPRFAIALHAAAAGDYAIKTHLRFWLCNAKTCRPIDVRRSVAVAVSASPTGPST